MLYNLIKGAIKEDSNICFSNINFILDGCIKFGKPIINYSLEEQSIDGCSYCLNKSFYFDKVISCVEYTEISKKIVFGLKYNNKTYLSKYIVLYRYFYFSSMFHKLFATPMQYSSSTFEKTML